MRVDSMRWEIFTTEGAGIGASGRIVTCSGITSWANLLVGSGGGGGRLVDCTVFGVSSSTVMVLLTVILNGHVDNDFDLVASASCRGLQRGVELRFFYYFPRLMLRKLSRPKHMMRPSKMLKTIMKTST